MRSSQLILPLLCGLISISFADAQARSAPRSDKAVLLSKIQSLTLHAGKKTTHRRVSALPQLQCIGGNAKGRYEVATMRCTNQGSSYSEADIEWSCTASLPPEVKLGSTDVICEGYRDSEDDWVLKGSCGVEYRLVLTELGEKKFASSRSGWSSAEYIPGSGKAQTKTDNFVASLFWLVFIGVVLWMIYSFLQQRQRGRRAGGAAGGGRPGGGGGGGGGGWWPGTDSDEPPPPYTPRQPPRKSNPSAQSQGWRPGFWSGTGAGAAAGYAAGRFASNRNNTGSSWGAGARGGGNSYNWDRGEGSSGSSGGSSNVSSSRYTSTGFGSTSRR